MAHSFTNYHTGSEWTVDTDNKKVFINGNEVTSHLPMIKKALDNYDPTPSDDGRMHPDAENE
jgi:hypothetical protein